MGNYLVTIQGYQFAVWKARLRSEIPAAEINPYVWFVKDMQLGYFEGNNFDTYRDAYSFCEESIKEIEK